MKRATHVERVMGTAVRFVADGAAPDAIAEAVAWLHWVDRTFSVHRPDSEVIRLRRGDLTEDQAHPEVRAVLERCMALRIVSDGSFDHRPEDGLDPSGYVKGWAIERAAELLGDCGDFHIDAGGDIAVRGRCRVGIRDPGDSSNTLLAVELVDQAIATSGSYERGEHIWGPGNAMASVSVIGPDLGTADALSTALYASPDAPWFERFPGYEAIFVTKDQRVLMSAGVTQGPDLVLRPVVSHRSLS